MEHMDEKIIALMNERRGESHPSSSAHAGGLQLEAPQAVMIVQDEILPMKEYSLLEDRLKITFPKTFSVMSQEMASLKYPSERRPNLIYTNHTASINIAFNHTSSRLQEKDMEVFKNVLIETLKKTQPGGTQWLEEGIHEVKGKRLCFFDFIVPALDSRIYNLIFALELEGRALLCTFNCTEDEMEAWKPVAFRIMNSVTISAPEEEGGINQ